MVNGDPPQADHHLLSTIHSPDERDSPNIFPQKSNKNLDFDRDTPYNFPSKGEGAMEKADRREICDFFRSRGERCLKIMKLPTHQEGMDDFNCIVITPSGKKENVFIRLHQIVSSKA